MQAIVMASFDRVTRQSGADSEYILMNILRKAEMELKSSVSKRGNVSIDQHLSELNTQVNFFPSSNLLTM